MILRPYQLDAVRNIDEAWEVADNVMYVLPCRGGKCMGKGTPILMYDGSIRDIETIIPGELLMGAYSKPRTVLSTCTGREEMYNIIPNKGDSFVVNRSHILSLKKVVRYRLGKDSPRDPIVNIPVHEYLEKSENFKNVHRGWRTGVNWEKAKPLPIDPYFLGLWLGDGGKHATKIWTPDAEIRDWLVNYASSLNMNVGVKQEPGCEKVTITGTSGKGYKRNLLLTALRDVGVIGNKHIPHIYKTASRKDRLKLLAGLMDSDGHFHGNSYDIVQKIERLTDDIVFVARSLGFSAYKRSVQKKCQTGAIGIYYGTMICGDTHTIPCILARKKATNLNVLRSVLHFGFKVEPLGIGDYYGFELDGDGLYLLGDFTVTHNTPVVAHKILQQTGITVAIAHRGELITQLSRTLARNGIRHRVIGSKVVQKECVASHLLEFGINYVDPNAKVIVASVDTLIRMPTNTEWFDRVALWICDESAHLIKDNKWGTAVALFPKAKGLGVTATPCRGDGKGLGRHADGVIDVMIEGPTMRELTDAGYLAPYRIFAPRSNVDLSHVPIAAGGDYSPRPLEAAVHKSRIIGDIVSNYLRIAPGKLAVCFCVSVKEAYATADAFNAGGVPAIALDGATPTVDRIKAQKAHQAGEIKVLVNVDLFSEGVDIPMLDVVIFARPTASFPVYYQMFCRPLNPIPGKIGIIIDHVNNVMTHGLPDATQYWTLDRRDRTTRAIDPTIIKVRTCDNCAAVYERVLGTVCPYCSHVAVPIGRTSPTMVDGDLHELDQITLNSLRNKILAVNSAPKIPYNATPIIKAALMKRHRERLEALEQLKHTIACWAADKTDIPKAQREFYLTYNCDVGTAQTLKKKEADALREKIENDIDSRKT